MGGIPARALWGVLLLTIVGEFAVCAVLERGVPGYDARIEAMSALGAGNSPVRLWYRAWLVWLGPAFAVGALLVHAEVIRASSSPPLAAASAICLVAFGTGAGVVAGVFPGSGSGRLPATLHGAGSALGFMALVAVPMLLGIAFKTQEPAFPSCPWYASPLPRPSSSYSSWPTRPRSREPGSHGADGGSARAWRAHTSPSQSSRRRGSWKLDQSFTHGRGRPTDQSPRTAPPTSQSYRGRPLPHLAREASARTVSS